MMPIPDLEALEHDLGVSLGDGRLIERALTHGSVNSPKGSELPTNDNLAFLGDAVIGLAIRDHVYRNGSRASLGELSQEKDREVGKARLAVCARALSLGPRINVGKGAVGAREQDSVLATAFEAIVGAIHLEKGLHEAASCALRLLLRTAPLAAPTVR